MFKIATWNVNSIKVRGPQVVDWLSKETPTVLALQETKSPDPAFPYDLFQDHHVIHAGQKTYNGVALISQEPIELISDTLLEGDPQKRYLLCQVADYYIANVYVPNGQSVGSEKYQYKLDWLAALEKTLKDYRDKPLIVLGDFNIAPHDIDVHAPEHWADQILCSAPERSALQSLLNSADLVDSFRLFEQVEKSFSWWDYRQLGFKLNKGLRIDLILIAQSLATRASACIIDKSPRKLERPSDHAPVLLTLD